MKKRYLIIFLIVSFIVELSVLIIMTKKKIEIKNDTVELNELTKEIENNYGNTSKYPTNYEYVIIDNSGSVLYKRGNSSQSLTEAYVNNDIVIDLVIDDNVIGKIIVKNKINSILEDYQTTIIYSVSVITVIQMLVLTGYYFYLYKTMIKPFKRMRDFAERIAGGNLDVPLDMDKGNNFGAFTESFDIMRYELKKARIAEMEAEKSKRELVARLSHDIKTPVASITALAEVGMLASKAEKERFTSIKQKADQINTLISNLFTITLEELDELSVNPSEMPSYVIKDLINNSDYLNRVKSLKIKNATVFFDRLRLQQVFDNIIMNSYKYANTEIEINTELVDDYMLISIRDFGNTIKNSEIPLLFEKYKRGSNVMEKEGAGLGLYITKRFVEAMNGKIEINNARPGFRVNIYLRII